VFPPLCSLWQEPASSHSDSNRCWHIFLIYFSLHFLFIGWFKNFSLSRIVLKTDTWLLKEPRGNFWHEGRGRKPFILLLLFSLEHFPKDTGLLARQFWEALGLDFLFLSLACASAACFSARQPVL
jgi:hypothetical protein